MYLLLFEIPYITDYGMIFDYNRINPINIQLIKKYLNLNLIPNTIEVIEDSLEHLNVIIDKYNPIFLKVGYTSKGHLNEIVNEVIVSTELNKKEYELNGFSKLLAYSKNSKINKTEFDHRTGIKYPDTRSIDTVIFEYINGITLKKFLDNCTFDEFINVLKQIIYTLYEANIKTGFTHYDLHDLNIMIEKLDSPKKINYKILNKTIITNTPITIIDTGVSFINNKKTGLDWAQSGSKRESWWVHDIFKIIMFMYTDINYDFNIKNNSYKDPSILNFDNYENPITFIDMMLNRIDISNETKEEYTNIKISYNKELQNNNKNIKEITYLFNNIIVEKLKNDYINKTNELIYKFAKNKVRDEKIKNILSDIIDFFEIIPDDEGSVGNIDDILYLYEFGILQFFQIPKDIAHDVHPDDFTKFIIHFNKILSIF